MVFHNGNGAGLSLSTLVFHAYYLHCILCIHILLALWHVAGLNSCHVLSCGYISNKSHFKDKYSCCLKSPWQFFVHIGIRILLDSPVKPQDFSKTPFSSFINEHSKDCCSFCFSSAEKQHKWAVLAWLFITWCKR